MYLKSIGIFYFIFGTFAGVVSTLLLLFICLLLGNVREKDDDKKII